MFLNIQYSPSYFTGNGIFFIHFVALVYQIKSVHEMKQFLNQITFWLRYYEYYHRRTIMIPILKNHEANTFLEEKEGG